MAVEACRVREGIRAFLSACSLAGWSRATSYRLYITGMDKDGVEIPKKDHLLRAPRAENDKINVLDEPYFCTHILSNHPPSSGAPKAASGTQSSPQRSQVHSQKQQHSATNFHKRPAIQWVAPVIRKVKVSRHSFIASQFGIGCTLKIHIIGTHLLDVLKETGKTFHNESDEVVEQAHYRVNAFKKSHGYLVSDRKMQTPSAAEKQQKMMEHLNSVHLR